MEEKENGLQQNGFKPDVHIDAKLMDSLTLWNNTASEYPKNTPFYKFIDDHAFQHPDKTAIIFNESKISYQELSERSNQFANYLKNQNINSGDRIALALDRSAEMVIYLIGILKSGAAYIPLDPGYPVKRIEYMLNDSSARMVISSGKYKGLFNIGNIKEIIIDEIADDLQKYPRTKLEIPFSGNDSAYIIYTSGSTGEPKGIVIEHHSLNNFLFSMSKQPGISANDKLLAVTTISFDISGLELYLPLINGAELVLADTETVRDGKKLVTLVRSHGISIMQSTPSGWRMMLEAGLEKPSNFKILCGGEALHKDLALQLIGKCDELWNMYGPTETTIWSATKRIVNTEQEISIGRPIDNTQIYILDEYLNPVAAGITGNLYIAGEGLAREYLNKPELTAKSFIKNPFSDRENSKIYRTGDLGQFMENGEILCFGRSDNQVKIRGHRVELGAIENALNALNEIKESVVIIREDHPDDLHIVAYVISANRSENDKQYNFSTEELSNLNKSLQEFLPDYMLPAFYVGLDKLPLLPNGKIDRKLLPQPQIRGKAMQSMYKAPSTPTERLITDLWKSILNIEKIGIQDNFFDLGGNSLLAVRFAAVLEQDHVLILPVTKLYQFPFIEKIASILDGKEKSSMQKRPKKKSSGGDIAIIGMAGRFPGANTVNELWEILKAGKETTSFFSVEELDKSIPDYLTNNPDYVRARGIIDNPENFDAAFFGINNRMAEIMDPQQRILLEIAWEALESSGHLPEKFDGKIGVFAGSGSNSYYLNNIHPRPEIEASLGKFQVSTLNDKDYIAMRIAYELNLKGPAVSVYSSSSTSLLAIAQAVESLRQGLCDVALAGGVTINSPIKSGHLYEDGAMFSRDGHCRPFDASATGTVFSDGAGIVLLKPLEDAQRDGDTIFAVLKGVGVNNDGRFKASFTAPHAEGQADAILIALSDAELDPADISYIEAHGTATPLGDPIEIEALKLAFGDDSRKQFCAIGSVKGNMGHLTHAAGVTGVIKTVLALQQKQIPASLFYEKPNPNIDFVNSPFYVNNKLSDWQSDQVRRAGVSSFGIGGTNIHVILEEYQSEPKQSSGADVPQLINWSAVSEASLDKYGQKLSAYLIQNTQVSLSDVAFTLQQTRRDFPQRRFIIASNTRDLISKLDPDSKTPDTKLLSEIATEVAFVFPGQGSQYLNMGKELYERLTVFRSAVDESAEILNQWLDRDIRKIIYPESISSVSEDDLNNTKYTQPAMFVVEYAMARLWMSWGIQPSAVTGHSIGEFVAAHFAGIFSLEDVLKIVAQRADMISKIPGGSMLAVKSSQDELQQILPQFLSIAAINSPDLAVISGTTENIETFSKSLTDKGFANRVIKTSHAFHSSMMDEITEPFRAIVSSVTLNPPRVPIVSTVTGKWMSEAEAVNPDYWAKQLRLPVMFADAVSTLWEDPARLLLEVGPGNAATIFARGQAKGKPLNAIAGFDTKNGTSTEYLEVLQSLGKLWQNGIIPDWKAVNPGNRINLPTYAFDRKRYWIEPRLPVYENTVITEEEVPGESSAFEGKDSNLTRKEILILRIKQILENASGIDMEAVGHDLNFIEIGLDSLLLTQVAITLKKEFSVPVSFRQLNENLNTLNLLSSYFDENLPEGALLSESGNAKDAISEQINELNKQLQSIQNAAITSRPQASKNVYSLSKEEELEIKKPFGASPKIEKQSAELSASQTEFLANLITSYNAKTKASKDYTQHHRTHMADPRVVSGFRTATKELVYPIVAKKSKGSRLWDIDGNEYIDALNGFGSNLLGYQPELIANAIKEQMDKGYEIGPQHELAGDVCKLICEFTDFDRAAICSTGSEAVMGTMRIARTVTGRSLIVAFSGSYHGIFDEVIIRGTKTFRSIPAAPGIMPEAVQNMLILDYGTDESLKIIRERAHEFAAVLVEPVQSRRPEFQPVEFLKEVRKITENAGTALIFDEVITGFRMHPGGTQAMFGIKADIASYGKVVGGGLPIGIIAGKKVFMDALDGGSWQFGDSSTPDAGVTYFAGTFVRHPLALIAAKTSLEYFKSKGPALQEGLNSKTATLMATLNNICKESGVPIYVVGFGSMWKIKFKEEIPFSELLFTIMRNKGIHILDGFPCFVTEAHTDTELQTIAKTFEESVKELLASGFLQSSLDKSGNFVNLDEKSTAPVPGAKLGRDKDGNPAWFVQDPENPGKYMQVKHKNN